MTVKELKQKLEGIPENMDVMLYQTNDDSPYNMVNTAEAREITFGAEDIPRKQWAKDTVFAITDE